MLSEIFLLMVAL
ncbi:hypothetical protein IEO21_01138 [Rhodonia placenta]|uniref:Uncharacterized protein n=1 Tax=Rhodonia placenta TaxID=104341 RepID=A0A8H7U6H9_9APHY|nr:hypothetical protein IEO21_01138 [Postia placenta]